MYEVLESTKISDNKKKYMKVTLAIRFVGVSNQCFYYY